MRSGPPPERGPSRSFLLLLAFAAVGAATPGCDCGASAQGGCKTDDDCRTLSCRAGEVPACVEGACVCNPDVTLGDIGRFSSLAMRGPVAYLSAYNTTYGDLMIGHVAPPGVVSNWEFVDGVPANVPPDNPLSRVRGGVSEKGDDVGRYCSIAIDRHNDPLISYYDATHGHLKFTSFGVIRWRPQVIDKGSGVPGKGGDDLGRYTSITLAADGAPGIAYSAEVEKGASGKRESQLRFAQAKKPDPQDPADWAVTVVETRPMPPPPMANETPPPLSPGVALFVSAARKADGAPVVAYYDAERGNLRYVEYDAAAKTWGAPVVLDGEDPAGKDTADVGQYPSVFVDDSGVAHISYVDASHDNLLYVNTRTRTPEVVDDGYRPMDEKTLDGLDAPVYHLIGDSSSIQVKQGAVLIAYQDSTVSQLRLATYEPMKKAWKLEVIAGHSSPFKGAYGFYAQNRLAGGTAVLSSYAVNQQKELPEFYVEVFGVLLGIIQ